MNGRACDAFDDRQKLERLILSLGQNVTADILGIDRAQLRRYLKRRDTVSAVIEQRIVDTEYILDRCLRVFHPDEVGPWLTAPEPLLGGAVPLNVLALRGAAPVIAALTQIAAGAFA